jgi:DNA-binding transcriptional LysR family regulator
VVPLRSLVFAVEAGSFTLAARKLGITPSGVSKHISRLEDALGARLLERTTRRVRATDAGRELYRRVRPLFEAFDEAEAAVRQQQDEIAGNVRISAAPAFGRACLVPALAALSHEHPKLTYDVQLTGRRLDFVEDEIDLAVREGAMVDSALTAIKLGLTDVLLCAAPRYLETSGRPRKVSDLERHTMLSLPANAPALRRAHSTALRGIKLVSRFRVDDLFSLRELAERGVGIAALPDYVARPLLESGALTVVLPRTLIARVPVQIVFPTRRHLPRRVTAVIEAIRAHTVLGYPKP